jgi:hypothetical protein
MTKNKFDITADSVSILMTSHARINRAFEDLRTSDMSLQALVD